MKIRLDKKTHDRLFDGFLITDCVVRRRDLIYFVLTQGEESEEALTVTREIQCVDRPGIDPWGSQDFTRMERMIAGVSYSPTEQFVAVTSNDHVFATGSGDQGLERDLKGTNSRELKLENAPADQYLLRGSITRLRTIDGRVWGCGLGRTVIDRIKKDEWNYHTSLPKNKSFLDDNGFSDIDGFSASDIYAVGGYGDLWHFDGTRWQQLAFPSNMELESICCGGDGNVYIGAESGTVFKGRDNSWRKIHTGRLSLPYKDMVWYQGSVWCTSDYGLWVITDDQVTEADVPVGVRVCSGNLSAGDGVLLVAGMYGAALHDGKNWNRIIDYNNLG